MAVKEVKVVDIMRGNREEVTIRFDPNDLVELPCHCNYDSVLCVGGKNKVVLVRKIEVKNPDGYWSLYPSASWLDGVHDEEQLQTFCVVKKTGEEDFDIMSSTDGVPDGILLSAAKKAGIHTYG